MALFLVPFHWLPAPLVLPSVHQSPNIFRPSGEKTMTAGPLSSPASRQVNFMIRPSMPPSSTPSSCS